ncbi:hypothetical protein ACFQL8_30720 [Streptomyces goshikiensis]|uniref:hypothetical protein n=1 Tax=Streptomyces goshikiensis TaxID=1942 RepID=UPI001679D929|nr:hypothetical protein [Streptomyces goshikiensis]GHD83274.1 hypothetical protein GCM10010336_74450 [Streptomyces goshikiensis]
MAQHEHGDGTRLVFDGEDKKNICRTGGDSFPNLPALKRAILADAVERGQVDGEQLEQQPVAEESSNLPRSLRLALKREAAEKQAPTVELPKTLRVKETNPGRWAAMCKRCDSGWVYIMSGFATREEAAACALEHQEKRHAPRDAVAESVALKVAVSWDAMVWERTHWQGPASEAMQVQGVIVTGANEGGACDMCGHSLAFLIEVEADGTPYQSCRWCLGRHTDIREQHGHDFETLACEYEGRTWNDIVESGRASVTSSSGKKAAGGVLGARRSVGLYAEHAYVDQAAGVYVTVSPPHPAEMCRSESFSASATAGPHRSFVAVHSDEYRHSAFEEGGSHSAGSLSAFARFEAAETATKQLA